MKDVTVICEREFTTAFSAAGFRAVAELDDGRVCLVCYGFSPDRAEALAAEITTDLFCVRTTGSPKELLAYIERERVAAVSLVSAG